MYAMLSGCLTIFGLVLSSPSLIFPPRLILLFSHSSPPLQVLDDDDVAFATSKGDYSKIPSNGAYLDEHDQQLPDQAAKQPLKSYQKA